MMTKTAMSTVLDPRWVAMVTIMFSHICNNHVHAFTA